MTTTEPAAEKKATKKAGKKAAKKAAAKAPAPPARPKPPMPFQRPMTLVMPLADPSWPGTEAMAQNLWLTTAGSELTPQLDAGGTVHFARFVVVDGNLIMASSYDGDFEDYIKMFIDTIGDAFNVVMEHVVDPAPTPVQQHPLAFIDWVAAHNVESTGFYSAYPDVSALQIRQKFGSEDREHDPFVPPKSPALPAEELPDIQGLILRGLGQTMVRHLVLKVTDAAKSRTALSVLGTDDGKGPTVTHGADRSGKPKSDIAVGVTSTGLLALGVPRESVSSFPTEFLAGAAARAPQIGDWDLNAPALWGAVADPTQVHLLISVYASTEKDLNAAAKDVLGLFGDGATETVTYDGAVFGGDKKDYVHFGYRDNISQPIIDGDPVPRPPDGDQAKAAPGEFLLGYPSQDSRVTLDIPQPAELGKNGSFTAFRVLEQNVAGFEQFLEGAAKKVGVDKELVAAKIVGRWRNGVPLVLSPHTDSPDPPLPEDKWNDYDYEVQDTDGLACPMGSHMRRANPRDQAMHPTGDSQRRRLMRRGMPYGPEWAPEEPIGKEPRGLLGHFIGASILLQFETVMGEWINRGMTRPEITMTNDILIGVHQEPNTFKVPIVEGGPPLDLDVSHMQFTTTKGSIYAFLPSMTALRWIGALED